MWVFCCGMPRSGSTLQFQITAKLVEDSGLGKRVEWCLPKDFPRLRNKYSNYKKMKVFKSHVATDEIIEEFVKHNAVGVYIFRDIRDVVVSHMRKYLTDFREILKIKFINKWINNYYKWINLDKVLVSKYETVFSDLAAEVKRISNHLGLVLNEQQCLEIAAEFALSKQLDRIEKFKTTLSPQDLNENGVKYDPHSLLHTDHIHSGKIGAWKEYLTEKEVQIIERKAEKWLETNGYQLSKKI
jgi:hypothetical protein